MGTREVPTLGQRWRSHVDGHTVVTVGQNAAHVFLESDRDSVTAAMIVADFLDDYDFVELAAGFGTTESHSPRSPGRTRSEPRRGLFRRIRRRGSLPRTNDRLPDG